MKKMTQTHTSLAHYLRVFIIIITILPYHLTIVLLRIQLTLNIRLHKSIHINDIISTIGTTVTIPSRTKLKVDQTLLIHAIVSILVIIVITAAIVVFTTELISVVFVRGGTLLEFEGISRDPGEVVVAVELTGCGEDAVAEFGGGGDVGCWDLDGCCCGGSGGGGEGGEEGDGAEHLWVYG